MPANSPERRAAIGASRTNCTGRSMWPSPRISVACAPVTPPKTENAMCPEGGASNVRTLLAPSSGRVRFFCRSPVVPRRHHRLFFQPSGLAFHGTSPLRLSANMMRGSTSAPHGPGHARTHERQISVSLAPPQPSTSIRGTPSQKRSYGSFVNLCRWPNWVHSATRRFPSLSIEAPCGELQIPSFH